MYGGKHGYGFEVTDTTKALDEIDFSNLKLTTEPPNFSKGCYFPHLREGVLAYVQKGRNRRMKNPFIVKNVEYNPNENTAHSINVTFEPTNPQSCEVTLYAQLPCDPEEVEEPINFRSYSQFVTAKDKSTQRLADNGCFWVVPDTTIVETLDELHISEGLQLII